MTRRTKLAAPGILFDAIEDDADAAEGGEDNVRDSYRAMRGEDTEEAAVRNPLRRLGADILNGDLAELE